MFNKISQVILAQNPPFEPAKHIVNFAMSVTRTADMNRALGIYLNLEGHYEPVTESELQLRLKDEKTLDFEYDVSSQHRIMLYPILHHMTCIKL